MASALTLRAFHLDLKWQHYGFPHYLALLDDLSRWGYNAVVLEYENMFPYRCCREAVHVDAWTMPQVRQFVDKAKRRGIEVIPLIQCFGHLEFVLHLPKYRHLAENPKSPSELCGLRAGAADLVCAMIDEVLEAHPEAEHIHIGGDEVWSLGTCPKCKRRVGRVGKSRMYIDFVAPFIERVVRAGKRPILWADMVLNHPEALDALSRDVVLCDWQYWPQDGVDPLVLDGGSGTWVTPMTLPLVKRATRDRFGPYWALPKRKDWPMRFTGWPYVGYLKKAGFDVILGSSVKSWGDNYSSVRYDFHLRNSLSAVEVAATEESVGVIVTSWVIRRAPMENQLMALAVIGQAMGKPAGFDPYAAMRRYERKRFGQSVDLFNTYAHLGAMTYCLNMTNHGQYAFDAHRVNPVSIEDEISLVAGGQRGRVPLPVLEAASKGLHAADDTLSWLDMEKPKGREIDVLRFSAEEARYKAWLTLAIGEYLRSGKVDRVAVGKQTNRLKALCRKTFAGYWTRWTLGDELRYRYGPDEAWLKQTRR